MNKEIPIPSGWRKLRKGTFIKNGDKCRQFAPDWLITLNGNRNKRVGYNSLTYIRKIGS